MTDRDALVAAVKADPDDFTRQLVLADWLDEHGDEHDRARAAFVRCTGTRAYRNHLPARSAHFEKHLADLLPRTHAASAAALAKADPRTYGSAPDALCATSKGRLKFVRVQMPWQYRQWRNGLPDGNRPVTGTRYVRLALTYRHGFAVRCEFESQLDFCAFAAPVLADEPCVSFAPRFMNGSSHGAGGYRIYEGAWGHLFPLVPRDHVRVVPLSNGKAFALEFTAPDPPHRAHFGTGTFVVTAEYTLHGQARDLARAALGHAMDAWARRAQGRQVFLKPRL